MNEKEESIYEKLDWKHLSYFDDDDSFMPFLGTTEDTLEKRYPKYHELLVEKNKILKNYPNVREIMDGGRPVEALNATEILKMREVMDLYIEILYIEKKDIFFQGMREQLFLFQRMDVIKSGTDMER